MPSQRDLLQALKEYSRLESERVSRLKLDMESTRKALEDFMKANAEYKKLAAAHDRAHNRYYEAERSERESRRESIRKLRARVYTEGPTPALIKTIRQFVLKGF